MRITLFVIPAKEAVTKRDEANKVGVGVHDMVLVMKRAIRVMARQS